MVLLWFVLALVLLAAALVLLRLDARHRARAAAARGEAGPAAADGDGAGPEGDDEAADADSESVAGDEPPADRDEDADRDAEAEPHTGAPLLAPFQRRELADRDAEGPGPSPDTDSGTADTGTADSDTGDSGSGEDTDADTADSGPGEDAEVEHDVDPVAAATAAALGAGAAGAAASSPRLADRVRGLLSRRRPAARSAADEVEESPADPLADSPVVRWLEEREFEPTPTPAPDFRHGDFAGGLPELGTVSHGVFRGRRAIMGVSGGRAVLALRRDTASDVVLDLSRPDVDAEPGFHDAGEVASLEARTSDVGRLDLVDRDRLAEALRDLPPDVRRVWAEGEWVAATVDGAEDPSTWDDAVVALHGTADVLAPLPPIGGRARPLPADVDPGAPGAVDGPDADPSVGMDGAEGTGVGAGPGASGPTGGDTPASAVTAAMPALAGGAAVGGDTSSDTDTDTASDTGSDDAAGAAETAPVTSGPRRAGHLRLVPDRLRGVRDLTGAPVVADRGDAPETPKEESAAGPAGAATTDAAAPDAEPAEPETPEEPDPFADVMEPSAAVADRGDVASDHLAPRPPLSRPSRGAGQAYPEDASVPPLAAGATTGAAGIKPIGSEDDADEIRSEVERFDAARTDGGSDLDAGGGGRHGSHGSAGDDSGEETAGLSVAELAAKLGAAPSTGGRRHRRRAEPDEPGTDGPGAHDHRERAGGDPDLEETRSLRLPPDLAD